MGRRYREDMPGAAFHIVTRTQGHADLLAAVRTDIYRFIDAGVPAAGAKLIASAVMPNHIHILFFQGNGTLGAIVQPILRRAALVVQRVHKVEGHVFERRFRSRQCRDQVHLRNTILYIHRNPVAAGLCDDAAKYEWSSHAAYLGLRPCGFVDVEAGRQIIACVESGSPDELRDAYIAAFDAYCLSKNCEDTSLFSPGRRQTVSTNRYPIVLCERRAEAQLPDLRDAVQSLLRIAGTECEMDLLRSRFRSPRYVTIRNQTIATLLHRGYGSVAIAEYFRISISTVSKVRCMMRWSMFKRDNNR